MGNCASSSNSQTVEDATGPVVKSVQELTFSRPNVTTEADGEQGTIEYRLHFLDETKKDISPWHDIPLMAGGLAGDVFNMVVEIPKMTRPKFEVATKEAGNPIAQDIKKGKLREYHGPIYWNYGMLPQTWEDPTHEHPEMRVVGDNDPLDVVEIGSTTFAQGHVVQVKVLGVLALIDDGELDWKVIAISVDDPLCEKLNSITDVEEKCPGVISGIREWLRWYKTPDHNELNKFGFDGRALDKGEALKIITETHDFWRKLCEGKTDGGKLWVPAVSDAELKADQQQNGKFVGA